MIRNRSPRSHTSGDGQPPAVARRVWIALVAAAVLPVVAHLALFLAGVPLGKPGTITYPYSDFASLRAARAPQMFVLATLLAASVLLIADARRVRRLTGYLLATAGVLGVGVWSLVSPPAWQRQQLFNMLSPSHDGAFFLEAAHVERVGVREYVRTFAGRAATPPAEMRGTRVVSNPPAATLLAVAVSHGLEAMPALDGFLGELAVDDPTLSRDVKRRAGRSLAFSLSLAGCWMLGAGLIFAAARLALSRETALAVALLAAVSPMTILFTPGKDPAQLATVGAFLLPWVLALQSRGRRRAAAGVAAGLALAGGMFVGLVHFWIAACAILAAWIASWRIRANSEHASRPFVGVCVATLAAAVGFALGAVLLWLALGYDTLGSMLAVAAAQSQVTRGPAAMPLAWQVLGLPLFLLFGGVGATAGAAMVVRRSTADAFQDRLGRALLLVTLGLMLATIGFTNLETPRLWIPFAALLVLGGGLRFDAAAPPQSRARVLAILVALQVAAAGVHWSLMDMREAELRLRMEEGGAPRFFD